METGTLKELKVKPGDVVENQKSGIIYTVSQVLEVGGVRADDAVNQYRIISRASDTPKAGEWIGWNGGDCPVSPDVMVECICPFGRADHEVAKKEIKVCKRPAATFDWDGTAVIAYRVRPEPVRETVKRSLHGETFMGYVAIDLVDGEPDWTSIRTWEDLQ